MCRSVLLIGRHVPELRQRFSFSTKRVVQVFNSSASAIFESVLILRAADAILDRQVLHRLHVERDAVDLGQRRLQATHHSVASNLSLVERLQIDQNAPLLSVVLVPSTPINDERLSPPDL